MGSPCTHKVNITRELLYIAEKEQSNRRARIPIASIRRILFRRPMHSAAHRFFFCLFIGNEKRRRTKRCLFEIFENRMVSMLLRLTYRRDGEGDCACVAAGIGGIFIGAITVRLYLRNLASISGRREFSLFYTNVRLKILENFQKACEKIEKKLTYIYEGENDAILFPSKA